LQHFGRPKWFLVLAVGGELLGGDELFDGGDDGADGVVAALCECAEDAHQDGLTIGAVLAAVAVAVLAEDNLFPQNQASKSYLRRLKCYAF